MQESEDKPVGTCAKDAGEEDEGGFGWEEYIGLQERRYSRGHVCREFLKVILQPTMLKVLSRQLF